MSEQGLSVIEAYALFFLQYTQDFVARIKIYLEKIRSSCFVGHQ